MFRVCGLGFVRTYISALEALQKGLLSIPRRKDLLCRVQSPESIGVI